MATFQKIISESSSGQVSISNRLGIGLSEAPSAPLHIENGNNGHAVIRLEDARSGDNSITAGGRLDFFSNHIQTNKTLGQIIYEQEGSHHGNVRFQIKGTLAGVGGKKLVVNDDNGKWSFYNNYTEDLALVIKNQKLGVGGVTNPSEAIEVDGNILLNLDANQTSHKLRLTGLATSEIYTKSYDAWWTTSLNQYLQSRDGFVHQNSDGSKLIQFKHDINSNHHIVSNMQDFKLFAGHNGGALGFLTIGSTTGYKAIQSVHTDNNTMGVKFNTKISGTDTERMRITSDGKIGIGTTSPLADLHVDGNFRLDKVNFYTNYSTGLAVQLSDSSNPQMLFASNSAVQTNTGVTVFRITDNTYNTPWFNVVGGGNIGMGTSSPRGKLDVLGSLGSQGFYVSSSGGAVYLPTDIAHSSGAGTFDIQVRNYRLGTSTGGDISIYPKHGTNSIGIGTASYQNKIFVNGSNGNVGVATTSPTSTFHVNGIITVNAQLRSHTGNGLYLNAQGSSGGFSHRFQQAGTDRVVIVDSTGYVGIGTTSPGAKLHVDGNIRVGDHADVIYSNKFYGLSNTTVDIASNTNYDIALKPGGVEAARFKPSGFLGIGTTSPTEKLEIAVTDNNSAFAFNRATVADNNWLGRIEFKGNNGTETHTYSQIHSVCANFEDGAEYSDIRISTSNGSNGLEEVAQFYARQLRMSHSNSRIGIGTNNPQYGLDVRSTGYFATAQTVDQLRLGDTTNGTTSSIRSVNNTMQFRPDGSNVQFFIGNTGKVGIQTSSPAGALSVAPDTNALTILGRAKLYSSVSDYMYLAHFDYANGTNYAVKQAPTGSTTIGAPTGQTVSLGINNSQKLTVKADSVGIGTTTPGTYGKLEVRGVANDTTIAIHEDDGTHKAQLHLRSGGNDVKLYQSGTDNKFHIDTESVSQAFTLATDGKVGISTSSPSYTLHTTGDTFTSEKFLILNNKLIQSRNSVGAGNFGNSIMVKNASTGNMEFTLEHDSYDFVFTNGKVGIGTTSPSANLEIYKNTTSGDDKLFRVYNGSALQWEIQGNGTMSAYSGNDINNVLQLKGTWQTDLALAGGGAASEAAAGDIVFKTNNVEKARLTNTGRFGIGTNSPSQIFHVRDSANSLDLFSIRSTGSETRIGIGKASADCAIDFSTGLPNGGGTIKNTFRMDFINNVRVGSHNGRLVLQSNNGIRIAAHNDNPSGNYYGLEVKHTRADTNDDAILNVMKNDGTSLFKIKPSSRMSLSNNDAGTQNTVYGNTAGNALASGSQGNSSIGHESMLNTTTGDRNTAIGYQSLRHNVTGSENVAVGYEALRASSGNSTSHNIAVGNYVMYGLSTGFSNIGIGGQALYYNNTGTKNIAIGQNAMLGTSATAQTGNVVIGYEAMKNPTTANYNVFVGTESGHLTTTGDNNVGVGYRTLSSLTQGGANVALGNRAFSGLTTGDDNIGIGSDAGSSVTTGSYNILMGDHNPGSTTMSNHTILGRPDSDRTSIFGRVALHSVSSNYATFSHYDQRSSGVGYALRQSEVGATVLNSASGQSILFALNNTNIGAWYGGNFGIGTTIPQYKLDLVDGGRINRASNDPYLIFARSNTSVAQIRGVSGGGINITDGGSGSTNSTSRIYVDNSGNVGIGDVTPSKKLDVNGSFQVQGTADFQDTATFEGDVDFTNASIEGLPAITVSPTTIFKCATTATNINFGVSLTKGDILFGTPTTENGTYISHTDNDEQITLKRAGEYEISVTLVVTAQSASNRFTCLTYVEHYNSSNTLLDSFGLEAMYIRSNGTNYNSGAMAGQIRITTGSMNTWVKVTSMVLDRESSGTVPLNTTYSKIRIDKIDYNQ